jgi:hypothetical protein
VQVRLELGFKSICSSIRHPELVEGSVPIHY